ncbi:glutathione-disulfide reductase protein [Rutstroemia sp. NJR-2017a BBW]|nr:glutathione-disulfide reductase protein [Rutstroemia sp. NJR-2017a BBW]
MSGMNGNSGGAVKEFDYIVIGGGSGGSGTARRAAAPIEKGGWGKNVLLVEDGKSGGCCVNVGYVSPILQDHDKSALESLEEERAVVEPVCIPKKHTWNFSSMSEALRASRHYGYDTPTNIAYSYPTFKQKRDAKIASLNRAYESNWSREGITLVHGTAKFVSPQTISVSLEDGSGVETFKADHICIATGGYPIIPKGVPGGQHGITNEGFFELEELPKKIAIVGAGYIAVEMAGMLNAIGGIEVHMFIRGDKLLRKFDPMVSETMTKTYEAAGIIIHRGYKTFARVEMFSGKKKAEEKVLNLRWDDDDGKGLVVNELLWAVGRKPATENLDLEVVGIDTNDRDYIKVDGFQNTSVPGIYALGDVTGQLELTPVAIAAGRQLSNRIFGPPQFAQSALSYSLVPTVVFAHPEVGTIGITEPEAIAKYGQGNIKVYHAKFAAMFYDFFPAEEKEHLPTEFKIICEGPEEKIVGLHLIGLGVGEMLQGFGVAIKMGARKRDFDACVAIHPTSAEEIVTMK